jgi:hypothetical protein
MSSVAKASGAPVRVRRETRGPREFRGARVVEMWGLGV